MMSYDKMSRAIRFGKNSGYFDDVKDLSLRQNFMFAFGVKAIDVFNGGDLPCHTSMMQKRQCMGKSRKRSAEEVYCE